MACFVVPAAEAVLVMALGKKVGNQEERKEIPDGDTQSPSAKIPFARKLKWLSHMLWGGTALLAFEHFWHGEIVPWFPFLTAMSDPVDRVEMFHEMATVGITMALAVTAVWGCMCIAADSIVKRRVPNETQSPSL
ncbi:MAG: hypothetical protein ACOX6D_02385 [Thermoguttaceae bacterium]|jgi:hypothetical protein